MPRISDRILLGFVSGIVGNLAKDASNFIMYKLGLTTMLYGHLVASVFTPSKKPVEPKALLAGYIADAIVGAGLGIPTVYSLSVTGKDYYALKGACVGYIQWLAFFGLFGGLLGRKKTLFPVVPMTMFSSVWHHTVYGAVTAYTAMKLGAPELFEEPIKPFVQSQRHAEARHT